MLGDIILTLVGAVILYCIAVFLSLFSLRFRVAVLKPSEIALRKYLETLNFPFNIILSRISSINLGTWRFPYSDPIAGLKNSSTFDDGLTRLGAGISLLLCNVLFVISLGFSLGGSWNYFMNLGLAFWGAICFIWAWRFGHQLKSIEAKLKSENPDLAD